MVTIAERALPHASTPAVTLLGVGAAIGVLASLAVHELAHRAAAPARGVERTTRWTPLSGVVPKPAGTAGRRWHQRALES